MDDHDPFFDDAVREHEGSESLAYQLILKTSLCSTG